MKRQTKARDSSQPLAGRIFDAGIALLVSVGVAPIIAAGKVMRWYQ